MNENEATQGANPLERNFDFCNRCIVAIATCQEYRSGRATNRRYIHVFPPSALAADICAWATDLENEDEHGDGRLLAALNVGWED